MFPVSWNKYLFNRWDELTDECTLMQLSETSAKIRLTAEIFMYISAVLYIVAALREARFLGLNMFIENLVREPIETRVILNMQKMIGTGRNNNR